MWSQTCDDGDDADAAATQDSAREPSCSTWRRDEEHPGLRRRSAVQQLQDGAACLSPSIKEMAPELVYNASVAMNAALAMFWSRAWGDEAHMVPYRLSGHEARGALLLDRLDSIPDVPTHDRELVTEWATLLGVADLYQIGPVGL